MKKALSLLLVLVMVVALFSGCGKKDDVIKIGIFEPLTGANAAGGQMELEGILTAYSLKSEVLGKKIELVQADNKSDDVEAVTAAEKLVDEDVSVILGSWGSSVCIAAGSTFKNAGIPAIGTSCTNPLVTLDNDCYFRVCYLDDFQGTLLANWAKNNGYTKAAVICDISDTYAIGLREYFIEAYGKDNIVAEAYFNKGDQEFSAQLSSVMAAKPDVIFAPGGYTEAGLLMKQAAELGYDDVLFLGGDTWETEAMIDVGGAAVEACRFTTFFDAEATPSAQSAEFLAAYDKEYGGAPKGSVTALGYDAYMTAVAAIEKAGSADPQAIRDALAGLEVTGVTGTFTFDENGDAKKNMAIIKTVEDGKFKYVETIVVD